MEPPLQPLCNQVNEVKITVDGGPPCLGKVNAPPAFPGPEEVQVAAKKRSAFLDVEVQGFGFQPLRCFAVCPQHAPPGNGTAVVAHDGAHLPCAA